MKNSMVFIKYLTTGLILIISVLGNQIVEASRLKGLRRNWEVKISPIGTEFPTYRDNNIANTGICVIVKLAGLNEKNPLQLNEPFIKKAFVKTSDNTTRSTQLSATPGKYTSPNLENRKSSDHITALFPENPIRLIHALHSPARGTRLKTVILSIAEIFRYLERLPGH